MPWDTVRLLTANDKFSSFTCGEPEVDDWFAKAVKNTHLLRTHLCLKNDQLVGFYTLKIVDVSKESNIPTQPPKPQGRGVLLAWMGIDQSYQGNGLGRDLLIRACKAACDIHSQAIVNYFVVDALNEKLAKWYENVGLIRVKNTTRLHTKMSRIEKLVEAAYNQRALP